jgi:hypothetical protein
MLWIVKTEFSAWDYAKEDANRIACERLIKNLAAQTPLPADPQSQSEAQ